MTRDATMVPAQPGPRSGAHDSRRRRWSRRSRDRGAAPMTPDDDDGPGAAGTEERRP
jgi:hypothetical protein